MNNKFTIFVHSKKDAMFLIHSLDDGQLKQLNLNCFTSDLHCYNVRYDSVCDMIVTTCSPFTISIRKSVRDTFIYVLNAFYPEPL